MSDDEPNGQKRIPVSPATAQMIVARNKEIIEAKQRLGIAEQRLADVLFSLLTENGLDPASPGHAEITPEAPHMLLVTPAQGTM